MYTFEEFKQQLKFNIEIVRDHIDSDQDYVKSLYQIYRVGYYEGKDAGIKQAFEVIKVIDDEQL